MRRPLLVSYGAADSIVLPAMAQAIAERCPAARLSEYAGCAHAPFLEQPARFNRELAELARAAPA
jgi:pimeloyl-ACP methyl ester carboxylesterase